MGKYAKLLNDDVSLQIIHKRECYYKNPGGIFFFENPSLKRCLILEFLNFM